MKRQTSYGDLRGSAIAQYELSDDGKLTTDVEVAYIPTIKTKSYRPGVIKIPQRVIEQLKALPKEMHGVPIDVLISISDYILNKEPENIKNKVIIPDEKKLEY